ncbi:elongation factor 1 gamma domain-containingprotein [Lichtheimia corymbifera JMRC:FSU:9682]|uniref:Elongation factor 1 gamma domain-containingprotein n=1 Tax=Lichtheimia corymbifera JMRC:FSU:9682 TaxID=1263082 RepID=A0A068SEL7_9FUNG|nr:elongation factor 1 gamma domain-containingprotein [Lichtheimia corymbifera JMRC:FSU:9682]
MSIGTIKSYPENPRVAKAKIAAAYSGVSVDVQAFDLQKDRDEAFYAKFPMGKIPAFEGSEVNLFEASAIAYYAALQKENNPILGANNVEKALIMQWILFAENEINTNLGQWVYPLLGYYPYMKPNVDAGIEKVKRAMDALNKVLLTKTYLVGEDITFADIAVVTSLVLGYKLVFDKTFRSQYKNVNRYFTTCINKPQFKEALGEITLCETALKYTPPKKEKKEKKEEPKKAAAAPAEEAPKPAPKPKSALDLLPKSSFVLDEWKRMYSNNDTDVAMKWFWENFDKEGWSIWRVDYRYNDELTLVFMSNNLIGGFFARLERARKYAFGSMLVTGTNNNNAISGYFIIRGQEVPYEIYDAADYPSYKFEKIEPSQYEEKKDEIEKYMAWEVEGFADGKIFK